MKRVGTPLIPAVLVCQVGLMLLLGYLRRHQLNPDAVSYIRIASYYAAGKTGLAVSGYWGPMLSWLMAPMIALFHDPLFAARVAMGGSGLVFTAGSLAVFRNLQLPPVGMVIGSCLVGLLAANESALEIAPDLLMAGLTCFGISFLLLPQWTQKGGTPLVAGLLLGAAYLAKAVALPIAVLVVAGIAALRWAIGEDTPRALLRASVYTLVVAGLVSAPWIALLSLKYGRPTISTTAKIAHAIVGPREGPQGSASDSLHPTFRSFLRPEPGRLTTWEDPTGLSYPYWSPFQSAGHLKHQAKLVVRNLSNVIGVFTQAFDGFSLAPLALALAFLVHTPWRQNMRADRWRWAAVPVVCVVMIYLPVFVESDRYYFVIYPFVLAAVCGVVYTAAPHGRLWSEPGRCAGIALILVSFGAPLLFSLSMNLRGMKSDAELVALAEALRGTDTGTALAGDDTMAMYVGLLLDRPFLGCNPHATPEEFAASGADVFIVGRTSTAAAGLAGSNDFTEFGPSARSGQPSTTYQLFRRREQVTGADKPRTRKPEYAPSR
ncbi:ArnT family glycosyltransferase [Singulisphaera acidiphila]|uniref:Glycosyltransferase RgtA/B/C/D-like domain-containing protein n=1 Tax=Singulisphaera acidiphila (strain ATCC BAA-1392 / DSM 18658 / VKM B-2454 / MOB10) TaxID=886293 RepID=L0DH51_SINAD|nr:hypothetical protein [Singulisphaera acidiphila]AGA28143.1 hypothetical protein Sinac_3915 [Singulisphaera acidiphila DSM 18658]